MNEQNDRLSQIMTCWKEVWSAQEAERRTSVVQAQWTLLERYGGAATRYLLGAVRDPDIAQEVAQEFAVAFLDGGVRGANPEKGRFRDYLKGVLRNLIRVHQRKIRRHGMTADSIPEPAFVEEPGEALDRDFVVCWRAELLARCWNALTELEAKTGQPYHAVLKARADHPDQSSDELAAELSRQLNRELTAPTYRKALQRAREKFAELLLDELRGSITDDRAEAVREELLELGLYEYCRPILDKHEHPLRD
jgi:DNA-directed RNA polymerase specialized sigma24 family protein